MQEKQKYHGGTPAPPAVGPGESKNARNCYLKYLKRGIGWSPAPESSSRQCGGGTLIFSHKFC